MDTISNKYVDPERNVCEGVTPSVWLCALTESEKYCANYVLKLCDLALLVQYCAFMNLVDIY